MFLVSLLGGCRSCASLPTKRRGGALLVRVMHAFELRRADDPGVDDPGAGPGGAASGLLCLIGVVAVAITAARGKPRGETDAGDSAATTRAPPKSPVGMTICVPARVRGDAASGRRSCAPPRARATPPDAPAAADVAARPDVDDDPDDALREAAVRYLAARHGDACRDVLRCAAEVPETWDAGLDRALCDVLARAVASLREGTPRSEGAIAATTARPGELTRSTQSSSSCDSPSTRTRSPSPPPNAGWAMTVRPC